MENEKIGKAIEQLQRVNNAISSSTTAQMLVTHAPAIIDCFKQVTLVGMQYQHELEKMRINRAERLEKFKESLPGMLNCLNMLLQSIFDLQATVREQASFAYENKNAETVISYTNTQIERNIEIFQKITFQLLN